MQAALELGGSSEMLQIEAKTQAFVPLYQITTGYKNPLERGQNLGLDSFLPWSTIPRERLRCRLLGTNSASSWRRECLCPKGRVGEGTTASEHLGIAEGLLPPNLHSLAGTLPKRKAFP